jgi:hypothetical protein
VWNCSDGIFIPINHKQKGSMMAKRIGDILIEMGFIDRDQLEMAATESKKTGAMLGDVLLRLDWITQEQLQMSLAVQSGAKLLDTDAVKVDPGLIAEVPQDLSPQTISCRCKKKAIPFWRPPTTPLTWWRKIN